MDQRASLIPGAEAILDRLIALALCAGPIAAQTDKYFTNTSRIEAHCGQHPIGRGVWFSMRLVVGG